MKKNEFFCCATQTFSDLEEDICKKGGVVYKHVIKDKTLYIKKDGVEIKLNQYEIMEILKTLGIATRDFQSGFYF